MTKFEIGDRVKHQSGIICTVHDVRESASPAFPNGVNIIPEDAPPFWLNEGHFELYAKAGEFVVSDALCHLYVSGEPPSVVRGITKHADGQMVEFTDDPGRWWLSSGYRLATPEEIAAAEAKTTTAGVEYDWRPDMAHVGDGPDHPLTRHHEATVAAKRAAVVRPEGVEIPASEFDFDTLRPGDDITVRLNVQKIGKAAVEAWLRDAAFNIFVEDIVSVTPAPRPKSLRERAIEAAMKADNGAIGAPMAVDYAHIVDAVLTEVEKG